MATGNEPARKKSEEKGRNEALALSVGKRQTVGEMPVRAASSTPSHWGMVSSPLVR